MFEATQSFTASDGTEVVEGETRLRGDHPAVQERSSAWMPVGTPDVEQATANPGEKRG